ncbi:hypothetical protein C2G38_2237031 [Gigaspora rosea]|uniref:Uncharacterized protein n=1 Tax=Gigaspora rosea TaxID=44941 RepID=A0A397TPH0_9GLOM|nr:hypothetical protein C2G38_2237031 [Gigaspora rosea]
MYFVLADNLTKYFLCLSFKNKRGDDVNTLWLNININKRGPSVNNKNNQLSEDYFSLFNDDNEVN